MRSRRERNRDVRSRRGLAPLELVAALPLILVVASGMLLLGAAGVVKVRTQINARYAMSRTVSARHGGGDPNPHNWSPPARLASAGGLRVMATDPLWQTQAELLTPAIRGPVISGSGASGQVGTIVVERRLEVGDQAHLGTARYGKPIPFLRAVSGWGPGGEERTTFDAEVTTQTLGSEWQFFAEGMRLGHNRARRADPWYRIDPEELGGEPRSFKAQLNAAHAALRSAPFAADLDVLDRDEELRAHFGHHLDFHPAHRDCRLPLELSSQFAAIANVPNAIAARFIRMYRERIEALRRIDPEHPGIPPLEALEQQYEQFRDNYQELTSG